MAEGEMDLVARAPDDSSLRQVELDDALARRTPRRLRAALVALTAIVLALALLPVWHSLAVLRQMPPTTADQGTAVEVTSSVTTGAVTLNGRRIGIHLPLLLYLRQGVNVIALDAPPFRNQTCRITAPSGAASDTCRGLGWQSPLQSEQRLYSLSNHQFVSAYVVAFLLGLSDLSTSMQAQALAAIPTALSEQLASMSVTVPSGNHFATALPSSNVPLVGRATVSLTAAPIAEPNRLAGAYSCAVDVCPFFDDTTFSDRASDTADPNWTVWLGVSLGWRFGAPSGAEVSRILFHAGLIGPTLSVTLAYHAGTGWYTPQSARITDRLRSEVAFGLCMDGAALLSSTPSIAQSGAMINSEESSATLEGCSLMVRLLYGNQRSAGARVLWRFGVLLAEDPASRALLPDLPLASSDEVAAVGA